MTNLISGIVIKKISYKEYHEILHIYTEKGIIESFFYENVNKNKKKSKITIPSRVSITYFPTTGMNKITNLETSETYNNIIFNINKSAHASNIIEIISSVEDNLQNYNLLKNILSGLNTTESDEDLYSIYCIINILKLEGFQFKYAKTNKNYLGFSFINNMFVDYYDNNKFYKLDNRLVKILYLVSSSNIDFLEKIILEKSEYLNILDFLHIVLEEYIGICPKSYLKIRELENFNI